MQFIWSGDTRKVGRCAATIFRSCPLVYLGGVAADELLDASAEIHDGTVPSDVFLLIAPQDLVAIEWKLIEELASSVDESLDLFERWIVEQLLGVKKHTDVIDGALSVTFDFLTILVSGSTRCKEEGGVSRLGEAVQRLEGMSL